jgi:hypothetical protein
METPPEKSPWIRDLLVEYIQAIPTGETFTRAALVEHVWGKLTDTNHCRGRERTEVIISDNLFALRQMKKIERVRYGVYRSLGAWEGGHGLRGYSPTSGRNKKAERIEDPAPAPEPEVERSEFEKRYQEYRNGLSIPQLAEVEVRAVRR